jgi:dipeptidyl aminopeptidase/acylaminoacyl peptidase
MNRKILLRKEIKLSSIQEKMIGSGWGSNIIESTVVESIIYISDGLKINGYIAYPADQSNKYPCIIWCRGGVANIGAIDEFNARGIFGQIASWGYVVFASQYRGNSGAEGEDEFGGADVNDVLNLIPAAQEIKCADINIWGIEGWSRGGMMTYLALTRTDIFKTAISIGGISNFKSVSDNNKIITEIFENGSAKIAEENSEKRIEVRSAVNFAERFCKTTPLLLIHGTNDNRIPVKDSIDLAEKLKEVNHPYELVLVEGGDHFLKADRNKVSELRKNWLARYLKQL